MRLYSLPGRDVVCGEHEGELVEGFPGKVVGNFEGKWAQDVEVLFSQVVR